MVREVSGSPLGPVGQPEESGKKSLEALSGIKDSLYEKLLKLTPENVNLPSENVNAPKHRGSHYDAIMGDIHHYKEEAKRSLTPDERAGNKEKLIKLDEKLGHFKSLSETKAEREELLSCYRECLTLTKELSGGEVSLQKQAALLHGKMSSFIGNPDNPQSVETNTFKTIVDCAQWGTNTWGHGPEQFGLGTGPAGVNGGWTEPNGPLNASRPLEKFQSVISDFNDSVSAFEETAKNIGMDPNELKDLQNAADNVFTKFREMVTENKSNHEDVQAAQDAFLEKWQQFNEHFGQKMSASESQ